MRENSHQVTRLVFWVLQTAYRQDPCTDFYDQYVKYVVSRKNVPFGVSKTKIYILTPFSPKNGNFGPIFDGTEISAQKGLNNGDAHV